MRTNRDLYLAISGLNATNQENPRTLEQYLLALYGLTIPFADRSSLALDEFVALLCEAYHASPHPYDDQWREKYIGSQGFQGWRTQLYKQVTDLKAMAKLGHLQDKMRYFGLDAPSGARWYNFEPRSYLECATVGEFGGWEDGDETGRSYVPGEVAFIDSDGKLQSANPQELNSPHYEITEISWDRFGEFLYCGQIYE